jgi:hypothetical protein
MNAFVASYDITKDTVSFRMESVVNGQILDSDDEFISLSKLSKDPWATDIAVEDEDDNPELREELTGILQRRFQSVREGSARNTKKFQKYGTGKYIDWVGEFGKEVTLKSLKRSSWESKEAKDAYVSFFKTNGVQPEFNEDGHMKAIPAAPPPPAKIVDESYPEFPRIPGSLGDLSDAIYPDIPYLFKVVAAITHFGLIRSGLDTLASEPHLQPRFYSALIAGPGRGKTAAINEIHRVFKAVNGGSYAAWPSIDSGPALVDAFDEQSRTNALKADGTDNVTDVSMSKILLSPDELRGLVEKSKVTTNSRNTMLDEFLKLFEGNTTGSRVRGAKIKIRIENAHLALVGGATPSGYHNMWTATGAAADGLHTRFVTVAADLPRMPARPRKSDLEKVNDLTQELTEQAKEPGTAYEMTDDAIEMYVKWWEAKPTDNPHVTRIDGIVKRLLIVLARTNDAETIGVDLMKPALAFGDYVQFCREKHNPADAVNNVQAYEQRIIAAYKKNGPMSARECARAIHPSRYAGGITAYNQAFDAVRKSVLKLIDEKRGGSPVYALDVEDGEDA